MRRGLSEYQGESLISKSNLIAVLTGDSSINEYYKWQMDSLLYSSSYLLHNHWMCKNFELFDLSPLILSPPYCMAHSEPNTAIFILSSIGCG